MPFWPRQHLEMPITRMGNEVNAQRVKGDEDERAGAGDGGGGKGSGVGGGMMGTVGGGGLYPFNFNVGPYYPEELPAQLTGNLFLCAVPAWFSL